MNPQRLRYNELLKAARPYGERRVQQLVEMGENPGSTYAFQFAAAAASTAMLRGETVEQVMERLWPELLPQAERQAA